VAFWALAEAVRARFGLLESDSGDTITERLDAGLAQYIANADERDWLRPRLTVLLGVDAAASFTRDDLFAAWTGFLEHLSDDGSAVVLVIDDAQYADDGLLDFLDHLLATTRSPMAVILLARPELLARRPDIGGRKTTVVRLEPLDAPVMAALIDGLVDGLPEAPRAALVERADGIPLFAVETVRALIDRDLVVPRDGRYVVAAGAELDLDAIGAPASLQALVAARLDALTPNEKRVITDASVLGLTFTRDGLLAFDPGSDPVGVDAALASLTRKELFAINTDRFSAERGQYRFVQSVVRQVAYGTQSKRDRKARHLAAAEHLETLPDPGDDVAVVIASHLLDAIAASPATDPDISRLEQRAVDELERATARARRVGAPAEALRLAELALTHSREAAAQARLHLAAAQAAAEADLHELATEHAVLATALFDDLDDPISAGHAVAAHAEAFLLQGDNAAATAIASPRLEALTTVTGSESAQLVLSRRLGAAARQVGDWDAYSRHADRAVILAESLDDQADFASAVLRVGGFYFMTGAPRMARIAVLAGAALAREHDLPEVLTTALSFLSAVENSRDLPTALRSAREGLEVSRRTGVRRDHELAVVNLLVGLWTAGNIEEFRRLLEDNPDDLIDPTFLWFVRTCRAWTADAQGRPLGELADQLTALDAREDPGTDSQPALAWQESARITVALDQGDPASAARVASISIEHVLAGMGIDDDFHLLIPPLVHAALAHHDVDLADRLLEPVTTALPGKRSPAVSAQWHRLRGLVAAERGTDPEFAETEMRTGITALDAFGAVGYRAQAQEELARWLVDQHRPEDAAPLIDAARTTYTEIGATGWLAKLDAWDTSRHSIVAP
jgi:hypothetical protein